MDIAARSLKTKRTVITKLMDAGLYPYTKRYLGTFDNHFSTIGLVGMNEACLNAKWLRKDLTHPEAQRFAKDVLNHMRERLSDYQEQYGDLYNLEATPAESTTYRFAKHDKELYPDIITANMNGTPYYTNSSHLPVGYTEDIFSALDVQDELQTLYTSGTVFHAFLGEKLPDWKAAANLVRKIAENYRLPYYTMSPTYSVCKDHGYLTGEQYTCPICGEKTEVYSRITGYYRPVQNWNDGKSQEFKDRKVYNIGNSHLTHQGPLQEGCAAAAPTPHPPTDRKAKKWSRPAVHHQDLPQRPDGQEERLDETSAPIEAVEPAGLRVPGGMQRPHPGAVSAARPTGAMPTPATSGVNRGGPGQGCVNKTSRERPARARLFRRGNTMSDILIIGGGIAGLTAAIYCLRAGKSVTVIEKETFGGQITSSPRVDNYPGLPGVSGNALADAMLGQVMDLGGEIEMEEIASLRKTNNGFSVDTGKKTYEGRAVILATGARHRPLGLDREEALTGRGISYCALCDGAFHQGEDVAVVGGGNSAVQAAAFLADICKSVTVIQEFDHFTCDQRDYEAMAVQGKRAGDAQRQGDGSAGRG